MNKRKILSLILAICLIIGMMPMNTFASSDNTQTVSSGDYDIEMRLNDWAELDLSDYVSGATSYKVTKDGETWTTVNKDAYNYFPEGHGERVLLIEGYDGENGSGNLVGEYVLLVYVEVPPSEVTITFSVTEGTYGFYTCEETGIPCLPTELTVPYFDLDLYDMSHYYYNPLCYENFTGMGQGKAGTVETAEGIVTPMHAMIYATEVLYLGYSEEEAGTGKSYEDGVFNDAISWNDQPAGSTFVSMWGHGTNLNYYLDWEYPLGAPATETSTAMGSTSDQIALYGGEDIAFHMIGEDSMAYGSSYGYFVTGDEYTPENQVDVVYVDKGESISLTRVIASEEMFNPGGTQHTPYFDGEYAYWIPESSLSGCVDYCDDSECDNCWNYWEPGYTYEEYKNGECNDFYLDDDGMLSIDTTNLDPGTYYFGVTGFEYDNGTECGATAVKVVVVDPAAAALAQAKADAIAELEEYADPADYREAQQAELETAITEGTAAINAATTEETVEQALEAAKDVIDAIKTDEELTAEEEAAAAAALAEAKADAIAELEAYADPADYREAQQAELETAITEGTAAINAVTSVEEVADILETVKATIDEIKTDAELTAEEANKNDDSVNGEASNEVIVEKLPAVDATKPVDKVEVGTTEDTKDVLEETSKEILDAVAKDPTKITNVDKAVVEAIKDATEAGKNVVVSTAIKVENIDAKDAEKEFGKTHVALVEKAADKATIAQYFDLSVLMSVHVDGEEVAKSAVSKLDKQITFKLAIPEELKNVADGMERHYFVIRVHGGEVTKLPAKLNADGTLSFETDRFSTYALAYEDVAKDDDATQETPNTEEPKTETPNAEVPKTEAPTTGDTNNVFPWIALMTIALAGVAVAKRREN